MSNGARELVATTERQKLTLVTGTGASLVLTFNEGEDGRIELEVADGSGDCAVWVGSDLVFGGNPDEE